MMRDDARTRRDGTPAGPMPEPVRQGRSLWRLAVLAYLPVLAVSVLRPLLGWDDLVTGYVDALRPAGPGAALDRDAVGRSLLVSTALSVAVQAAACAATWWLASRLGRRSSPARMALAVLAATFAVNAAVDLAGIGSADALGAGTVLLGAVAAALAVAAAVLTFRDATPRGRWFESAD